MATAVEGKGLHVVMLPWLGFGHMLPFLHLSKCLAKTGMRISFISTPRNIDRLPHIPPDLAARINLVKLPLPPVDNLPENAEATIDVPGDKISYLKKAYDLLQHPFEQFLVDESPDWVIHDWFCYWAPEIAAKLGVRSVLFSICFACVPVFFACPSMLSGGGIQEKRSSAESMISPPASVPFSSSPARRDDEAIDFFTFFNSVDASCVSDTERFKCVLRACQAVAVRSSNEYEGKYLDLLAELYKKLVIPIGLLPEQPRTSVTGQIPLARQRVDIDVNCDWLGVFEWLDGRGPKSVVFVAFGSECGLTREQVFELAYGLELSMVPFVWALRKPHWATDDVDILPRGFEDRTSDRGFARIGWAPQLEILAHQAIGGCLFHGGCSSVIECHQFGHTIIAMPMLNDQVFYTRMIVEKGLAVEVERNECGSFTRDAISKSLRHAMVEEGGETLRLKSRQMKTLVPEWERQGDYIGGFAKYLNGGKNEDSPI